MKNVSRRVPIIFSVLALLLIASLALAMGGKPKLPEKKWDPSVNNIRLGDKYQEVISALGKPQSRKNRKNKFRLIYDGLVVEVDCADKKNLWVSGVEITSAKWGMRPDIKVGMLKKDVVDILGVPLHQEERDGSKVWMWWWHGNQKFDSLFSVTFENDKAIQINFSEDVSL
jgi:hypothetical protein